MQCSSCEGPLPWIAKARPRMGQFDSPAGFDRQFVWCLLSQDASSVLCSFNMLWLFDHAVCCFRRSVCYGWLARLAGSEWTSCLIWFTHRPQMYLILFVAPHWSAWFSIVGTSMACPNQHWWLQIASYGLLLMLQLLAAGLKQVVCCACTLTILHTAVVVLVFGMLQEVCTASANRQMRQPLNVRCNRTALRLPSSGCAGCTGCIQHMVSAKVTQSAPSSFIQSLHNPYRVTIQGHNSTCS